MTTPPPGESILPEALTEEAVGERLREIRIALHDQGNSLRPTLLSLVGIVDALAFSAKCNFDAIRSLTNRSAAPPLTGEAVAESLIDDYCDMRPDLAAIRETLLDFGDRCAAVVLLRMRRAAPPVEATKSNVRQTDFAKPSVEADKPAEAGDEERAKSIAKAITQNNPQCYGYAESAAVMALAEGRALEREKAKVPRYWDEDEQSAIESVINAVHDFRRFMQRRTNAAVDEAFTFRDAAVAERDRLDRELDAYKRAKAENDERFMIERDEARQRANTLTADRDRLRTIVNIASELREANKRGDDTVALWFRFDEAVAARGLWLGEGGVST